MMKDLFLHHRQSLYHTQKPDQDTTQQKHKHVCTKLNMFNISQLCVASPKLQMNEARLAKHCISVCTNTS